MKQQERIIELQRQIKIARYALTNIACGASNPESRASEALDQMRPLEKKLPLQELFGHDRRRHE